MENRLLFIGSACVDVVIRVERLPKTAEDIHPKSQTFQLGGCACNAVCAAMKAGADAVLAAPVGTGLFGSIVEKELGERNIPILVRSEEENGCCYCFIEDGGERTFLSVHGAEYLFDRGAMKTVELQGPYAYTYVCGLEIEEETGEALIGYLKDHPESTVMYCPGPRGTELVGKNRELFELHPILHVNAEEAVRMANQYTEENIPGSASGIIEAAKLLQSKTGNLVIVTLGKDGALVIDRNGTEESIPGEPVADVSNTNGAGDTHAGAFLAKLSLGASPADAVRFANCAAAEHVRTNR